MHAAVMLCQKRKAKKIVVAAPVAAKATTDEFREVADDVIILEQPPLFHAVAQVYKNWYDVGDDEVKEIFRRYEKLTRGGRVWDE